MRGYVNGPDVAIPVNFETMRPRDWNFCPGLQHFAGLVKFDNRMRAAIKYPDIIVLVDGYARAFSEIPAFGKLRPVRYQAMRQRRTGLEFRECRERGERY